MIDRLRDFFDPERRVRWAANLLIACAVLWPATHVAIAITRPEGATSWVFHLLLALSWLAIVVGCIQTIVTTDMHAQMEDS